MEKELKQYYEDRFTMFTTKGWKDLVEDIEIPTGSFIPETMKAKCCFQIWKRREEKRELVISEKLDCLRF